MREKQRVVPERSPLPRMVKSEMAVFSIDSLPLGYRFCPTDVELVNHYLKGKNSGQSWSDIAIIPEINMCKCEPWDVPAKSLIKSSDSQWFFFCPKDRKYLNSNRSNRATGAGFWKPTGRERRIKSKPDPSVIGTKKTLVFYRGLVANGVRTNWIMHEYRIAEPEQGSGEQSGFVLCRLFKKPEERTSISVADDCMERNPETMQNSILSPASTMLSPDSDTVRASVEPVAPADQNFAVIDLQENVQPLPQASDMHASGENDELFPDEASSPSIPGVRHFNGTVLSDSAADHESDETTWHTIQDNYRPEHVAPEFDDHGLDGFHINSPLFSDVELASYDVDSVGQKFPPELYQCHSAEEDIDTVLINSLLCDDECFHDKTNAFSLPWKLDPEDQSFLCPDIPHRDSFSVKEIQTGLEGKDGTTSDIPQERVEFSGETCKLPICSICAQQNNYIDPTKQGMNQFSLVSDQNLGQDISFVEATTSSSHQVSAEMDDLDSTTIKIRTHKNSSDSDCFLERGLARRRLRLQKFVHMKSPPRAGHVSNITIGDLVIPVVSEVRETVDLQFCENLEDVASHDELASTVIQCSSSKMHDDSNQNILRQRAKCGNKDQDLCVLGEMTTPSASHCTSGAILILSALSLLIFIGFSWRLSS